MRGDVEQLATGVHRLEGSCTNAYIIADGDDTLLVDALYPADVSLIPTTLRELDRSLDSVSALLITHGHVDHLGAARRLHTAHGVDVRAHRDEAPNVRGEREERIETSAMLLRLWRPTMLRFVTRVLRAGALRIRHPETVVEFDVDGQPLDVPGRPEPVFTPGHTSGHCAYLLRDRGVLLTGDALVTQDVLTDERGARLLDPLFNTDQAATVSSLDRLAEVDAEVVGPGHGPALYAPPAEAVAAARSRLDG